MYFWYAINNKDIIICEVNREITPIGCIYVVIIYVLSCYICLSTKMQIITNLYEYMTFTTMWKNTVNNNIVRILSRSNPQ